MMLFRMTTISGIFEMSTIGEGAGAIAHRQSYETIGYIKDSIDFKPFISDIGDFLYSVQASLIYFHLEYPEHPRKLGVLRHSVRYVVVLVLP